jgi:N-acetylmuramoyl-L-alanine amidase
MAVALSTTVASAAVQKRAVAKTPRYAIPDASKGWPAIAGPAGNVVICLDPGHPSEVSDGTRGKKITEIHAAWEVALKLRRLLLRDQYRVVMTKSSEMEFVTNRRRADIANHFHAALMLRLHCDDGSKSGFGSYYPDRAVTLQGHHGPPASVLSASRVAAQIIHSSAIDALRGLIGNAGLHTDRETFVGHKQGGLTGSVFSNVPTVLVEMAVLGNKHDDDFISKPEGQEKMAEALERGLLKAVPRQ